MGRLFRDVWITEKIDGTNSSVFIGKLDPNESPQPECIALKETEEGMLFMLAGKRTSWITPKQDNYGFAGWVQNNADDLFNLGEGLHFGEWWGAGIQRRYGLKEKRFSLFNAIRWCEHDSVPSQVGEAFDPVKKEMVLKYQKKAPKCCHVVPVLNVGEFNTDDIKLTLENLKLFGSMAAPGFMDPEGIVTFHIASNIGFKTTIKDDHKAKSQL